MLQSATGEWAGFGRAAVDDAAERLDRRYAQTLFGTRVGGAIFKSGQLLREYFECAD